MDNRLREIEQWVAEARDDLGEGGREAYVRKLYLLDAEIRAVIKDCGILPEADSPRPVAMRVRRFAASAVPVAGALVVLLAASTVYLRGGFPALALPLRSSEHTFAAAHPAGLRQYLAMQGEEILPDSDQPRQIRALAQSKSISHSTILTAQPGATDPSASQAGPSSHPAGRPAFELAAAHDPVKATAAGINAGAGEMPAKLDEHSLIAVKPPVQAAVLKHPASSDANEATPVAGSVELLQAGYSPDKGVAATDSKDIKAPWHPRSHNRNDGNSGLAGGNKVRAVTDLRLDPEALKKDLDSSFVAKSS